MNIELLCVGRLKDRFFEEAAAEYIKRLGAYGKVTIREIPASPLPEKPSDGQIEGALKKEAEAIKKLIPKHAAVFPLCIEGKMLTSEEFSQLINATAVGGQSTIVFLIGGSYGLSEELKTAGKLRLSLSPMTFPHRLARIMLLEQLYRAFTILEGKTYHK